ncbi:MAG: ATP-binding protein [Proteobacteria bacterium]|nr:ATP-binding protein [Pseudomonadota bacterium]
MKEIVVLSGKGGVGKSTLVASLCLILQDKHKVVMTDTDVDAPNLALFFEAAPRYSQEVSASEKAFIDYERCVGCMLCVGVCKFSAMTALDDKPVVIPFFCEGCGACAIICPESAIDIRNVVNGKINIADVDNAVIVSGELTIGESSSGKLIDEVKITAKKEAERTNADVIITDGPPGIGCPVIASIKGSDYMIAVTEPTPPALSDLKRLLEIASYFKIPTGIVINKSDMHPKSRTLIKSFAKRIGLEILSEIPYDASVPKAISNSMPVVKAFPKAPSSKAINSLGERLKDIIKSR